MSINRREWLARLAAGGAGLLLPRHASAAPHPRPQAAPAPAPAPEACLLALKDFQPRSMLHVAEHKVERARFPVIDIHTHLGWAKGEEVTFLATPAQILPVMDRKNVRAMVNLTGGSGAGLAQSIRTFEGAAPGRFVTFTEPSWHRVAQPGYPQWQADEMERAKKAGAKGLKVLRSEEHTSE